MSTDITISQCGNYKPLLLLNGVLYSSKGYNLYTSDNFGETYKLLCRIPVPFLQAAQTLNRFSNRLFRAGLHSLVAVDTNKFLAVVKRALYIIDSSTSSAVLVHTISRGSRPLNLCHTPENITYYGEYFSNDHREEVNIYCSHNTLDWTVVYTFPAKTIRHVHGIYYDHYRSGIWVLTGDSDSESGLWFTQDHFKTLTPVSIGSQRSRAVTIIPTKDGLIVPMDSPLTTNHINYFCLKNLTFTSLTTLPGSCFQSCSTDQTMLISTVVEPSKVNTEQRASIFASLNGKNWKCIASFERELPRQLDRYFGYPNILFPTISGHTDNLFCYGIGISNLDSCCFKFSKQSLIDFL